MVLVGSGLLLHHADADRIVSNFDFDVRARPARVCSDRLAWSWLC